MAKSGFSRSAIEETQHQIRKSRTKVWEKKKREVEFPGHRKVKASIERHMATVRENQTDDCLHCHNSNVYIPPTHWRHKGTGGPPPKPAPPLPGTPDVQAGENRGAQSSAMKGVPWGYVYIHTPLPNAQFFNLDAYAEDRKRDKDFIPDLLTDERTSTGQYTISCVVMQLTSILPMRAAYWANLTVITSIDWKARMFWVLLLSTINGHFKVYFKGYICMHN